MSDRPRHFLMTPVGSSGDVHPFIGIGRALRARGHDVTVITSAPFRAVAERAGLRFIETVTAEEFDTVIRHPDIWHQRKGLRLVLSATGQTLRLLYARIADAYESGRACSSGTRWPSPRACSKSGIGRPR